MRYEMITPQHEKWLKENTGLKFEEVENLSAEESDKLCYQLINAECDALEEDSDDLTLISEVVTIIYDGVPSQDDKEEESRSVRTGVRK